MFYYISLLLGCFSCPKKCGYFVFLSHPFIFLIYRYTFFFSFKFGGGGAPFHYKKMIFFFSRFLCLDSFLPCGNRYSCIWLSWVEKDDQQNALKIDLYKQILTLKIRYELKQNIKYPSLRLFSFFFIIDFGVKKLNIFLYIFRH